MFHSNRKPKLTLSLWGLQDGVRISNPARDVGVFQSSCCPTIPRVFCRVHRGSKKGQTKRIRDTYEARLISIASHSHGTPSALLADQHTMWQIIRLVLSMEAALLHTLRRGLVPRSLACYSWSLDFTTATSNVTFGCAYCLGVWRLYSIFTPTEAVEKFIYTNMQKKIHALLCRS
jgi:hypothetical protein